MITTYILSLSLSLSRSHSLTYSHDAVSLWREKRQWSTLFIFIYSSFTRPPKTHLCIHIFLSLNSTFTTHKLHAMMFFFSSIFSRTFARNFRKKKYQESDARERERKKEKHERERKRNENNFMLMYNIKIMYTHHFFIFFSLSLSLSLLLALMPSSYVIIDGVFLLLYELWYFHKEFSYHDFLWFKSFMDIRNIFN